MAIATSLTSVALLVVVGIHFDATMGMPSSAVKGANQNDYDGVDFDGDKPLRNAAAVEDPFARLQGLFRGECYIYHVSEDAELVVSRQDVYFYRPDGQVTVTQSYFEGKQASCTFGDPQQSHLDATIVTTGRAVFHGPITAARDSVNTMELTPMSVNVSLGHGMASQLILNASLSCPCTALSNNLSLALNSTWSVQTPCMQAIEDVTDVLCQVSGLIPLYSTFQWISPTTYVSSLASSDKLTGWTLPIESSYPREKVSQSGSTNQEDCSVDRWRRCSNVIDKATHQCRGCQGIQCDGCAASILTRSDWASCCSCFSHSAEKLQEPWLAFQTC